MLILLATLTLLIGMPITLYYGCTYPNNKSVQMLCLFIHVCVLCPLAVWILFHVVTFILFHV